MTTKPANTLDAADVSLPDEILETAVHNLLICGPSMTDKFAVMIELLRHTSESATIITTKYPAHHVLDAYRSPTGRSDMTTGVVDAIHRSGEAPVPEEDSLVRYVGSFGNLTRIGVEFSSLIETVEKGTNDGRIGVGLHTLSPLIVRAGVQPVYRFLETLTARVRLEDYRCFVVLDCPVAEDGVDSLRHHFDAVIETQKNESGDAELRITGSRFSWSGWTTY